MHPINKLFVPGQTSGHDSFWVLAGDKLGRQVISINLENNFKKTKYTSVNSGDGLEIKAGIPAAKHNLGVVTFNLLADEVH